MSTTPVRSYCYKNFEFRRIKNNGFYDLIDRSDEDLHVSSVTSARSINYTALAQCTYKGDAGVMCDGFCYHTAISGVMTRPRREIVKTPG